MNLTIEQIIKVYKDIGYQLFDTGDYNLNIGGIRFNDNPDLFTDIKFVLYKVNGEWTLKQYNQTTKPGVYFLKNPANPRGCAILREDYYRGCWQIGLHFGHRALVQVKPVTVYRDNLKTGEFVYDEANLDTGLFGIDHHGVWNGEEFATVSNWSAGCQVLEKHYEQEKFMDICDKAATIYGNSFSYALFNEKEFL